MSKDAIDINEATVKAFVEKLRPKDPEIRKQLDIGYSYDVKAFKLYEIRPVWNRPEEIQHLEFVKMRYYKSRGEWNLYWMRANGTWELYEPFSNAKTLAKILEIIKEDPHGCFFG